MTAELKQACLNCGAIHLDEFYHVDDVPVHSVLLMHTQYDAITYPKKNISLALCVSCGFIQNTSFNPHCHEYSERYEETQGFSPHFQKFSHDLAADLIERHKLQNKTIVEIGCGKGEFLTLLCRLGNNRGIGVDASYVAERDIDQDDIDIVFIQDIFEEHTSVIAEADFIVCRHTLEHISGTAHFLRKLRQAIPNGHSPAIYFDLPDTTRVLKEAAFWDVYYEHCSYFTPTSLANVFRAEGFSPSNLYRLYDDQMLAIEARPGISDLDIKFDLELSVEEIAITASAFGQQVKRTIHNWRVCIKEANLTGRSVTIWGSGSKAVSFICAVGVDCHIDAVVDINPYRQGSFLPGSGHKIESPEYLSALPSGMMIIMNPVYQLEITQDLARLAVDAEVLVL